MALKDTFQKTLVYFGLAEEHDVDDWDTGSHTRAEPKSAPKDERSSVSRFPQRSRRDEIDDIFGDDDAGDRRGQLRSVEPRRSDQRVHFVAPKSFNDAQDVGDRFRDGVPVIINLQGADHALAMRVIDFASGLAYGLEGGMKQIADKVFVVTPRNVEFSAEQRAELIEKGFFNQT
jgi:cell division inhibitor SepF